MKVQLLQRRLLSQSAQLLIREAQLREAEQRQLQVQLELARSPGPQLQEQVQQSQRQLSERARRIKVRLIDLASRGDKQHEYYSFEHVKRRQVNTKTLRSFID